MISIVVPVFKVENYLSTCIKSIQAQTYSDFELILVDDGSPDSCSQICDEFASFDSRIKVIHKNNGGLSSARNRGIEEAKGDYITFIDSDDTINPNMLECMMRTLVAYDADICMCGAATLKTTGEVLATDLFPEGKVYQNESLLQHIVLPLKTASWNKIFKRTLIGDCRFPEGKIHGEDLVFFLDIINQKTRLVTTNYIGYNYYKRKNSITTSAFNINSLDEVWCKDKAAELIKEKFPIFERNALLWRFRARLNVMRKLIRYKEKYCDIINSYLDFLKNTYFQICNLISLKVKLEYILLVKFENLYIYIFSRK